MEFLKSVSEILDKFTKGQRMFALAMILLCATAITIGPSLVESITLDKDETDKKINDQRKEIVSLTSSFDSLSTVVRVNQMNCTNSILKREEQFIAMLDELKSESLKREATKKFVMEKYTMVDSLQIDGPKEVKDHDVKITTEEYAPLSKIIDGMKEDVRGDN